MKKFYFLFVGLLMATTANAQLETNVTAQGVFQIRYGAANDYSLYDPGFEVPTFYIHTFVNSADNTTGTAFEDAWTNSTVTMNWDSTLMAYFGTIDLNTKLFTQTNAVMPSGTTVQKVGMVFKDLQSGATRQSGDLVANGPTVLGNLAVSNANVITKSNVINGQLRTAVKGNITVEVYERGGKLIKSFTALSNGNAIDLNIANSGIYLVKITAGSHVEIVKFAK